MRSSKLRKMATCPREGQNWDKYLCLIDSHVYAPKKQRVSCVRNVVSWGTRCITLSNDLIEITESCLILGGKYNRG